MKPRNQKRDINRIRLGSLATWLLPTLLLGLIGLSFVYVKNQLHASGSELKMLERELAEITTQNEVLKARIASLSSRATLQRRLDEGFIKLIPISGDRIVRVGTAPARIAALELRSSRGDAK
jgi:cell division protein FtsB